MEIYNMLFMYKTFKWNNHFSTSLNISDTKITNIIKYLKKINTWWSIISFTILF